MESSDQSESELSGILGNAPHKGLLSAATAMLSDPQQGGLSGMIQHLKDHGLGDAVSSWVGTGPNQQVSGSQIAQALGPERLAQLAQAAGLSHEAASSGLASLLPHLIDRLTPGGAMPRDGLLQEGLHWVQSHIGSGGA